MIYLCPSVTRNHGAHQQQVDLSGGSLAIYFRSDLSIHLQDHPAIRPWILPVQRASAILSIPNLYGSRKS
jgi:hypothetical protein